MQVKSIFPRKTVAPVRNFFATEVSAGVVLALAVCVALFWANSAWRSSYETTWMMSGSISFGGESLTLVLRDWVNDVLMTMFFFVAGLEVKREIVGGELRDPRAAALPIIAALGGMAVPALLYRIVNVGEIGTQHGWAIPMATDIGMAVGFLILATKRVPPSLKLFLLTLAIADDIGAIIVIAVFYAHTFNVLAFVVAVGLVGVTFLARLSGIKWLPVYLVLGSATWLATFQSGIHATMAGVAIAFIAPTVAVVESPSVVDWLAKALQPWTRFAILPVFALANAGITVDSTTLHQAFDSPVAIGIIAGLVIGKPLGITSFSWFACRTGICSFPTHATWRQFIGVSMIAGIGFTVSLFVANLAFADAESISLAKTGILIAMVIAGALGWITLATAKPRQST